MPTRRHYVNAAPSLTLAGSITSGAGTLTVSASFTGWPAQFPFYATLDYGTASEEIVLVTGTTGSTATITRGQDGSTAVTHPAGATFDFTVVAADFDEANAHTSANAGVHGITGSVVGTSDAQTLTNKTLSVPTLSGNITLAALAAFISDLIANANIIGHGNLTLDGNASVGGNLGVTGTSNLVGATTVHGLLTAALGIDAGNNTISAGTLVGQLADLVTTDWNAATLGNIIYTGASAANGPGTNTYVGWVLKGTGSALVQVLCRLSSSDNAEVWIRQYSGTVWQSWKQVYGDTGELTSGGPNPTALTGWGTVTFSYTVKNGFLTVTVNAIRTGGTLTMGSAGTLADNDVATLAAGYRPRSTMWGHYVAGSSAGGCTLSTAGVLTITDGHPTSTISNGDQVRATFIYPL